MSYKRSDIVLLPFPYAGNSRFGNGTMYILFS